MASSTQDVAIWITREMRTNVAGTDVAFIRENLGYTPQWYDSMGGDPSGVIFAHMEMAYLRFYDLVKTGGPWDHKKAILAAFGEWSADTNPPRQYRYDIWSNIHYGYIGLACGFSEGILLDAAGAAQGGHSKWDALTNLTNLRKFDDPLDQEAIKVGFILWKTYKDGVQSGHTIGNVRAYGSRLAHRAG